MTERTVAYTADAIRAAEAPLLAAGRPLMREAARALAEVVADELARTPGPVLVLAGSGDNGGDALYAAADIAGAGTRVDVVLTRDRVHRDALDAAVAAGAGLRDASDICGAHSDHVLVVDGILGIGASSDSRLRGTARAVVEALLPVVASERVRVVAVDVPSGLHPDSGEADAAVRRDHRHLRCGQGGPPAWARPETLGPPRARRPRTRTAAAARASRGHRGGAGRAPRAGAVGVTPRVAQRAYRSTNARRMPPVAVTGARRTAASVRSSSSAAKYPYDA